MSLAHVCDQCDKRIPNAIRIVAMLPDESDPEFCSIECVTAWADARGVAVVDEPDPQAAAHQPDPTAFLAKDSVKRTCALCRREGSRRFEKTSGGDWQCTDHDACARRRGEVELPASPTEPEPPTIAPVPIPPSPPPSKLTARCTGCPRVWDLHGRVLINATDIHAVRSGHVVEFVDQLDQQAG